MVISNEKICSEKPPDTRADINVGYSDTLCFKWLLFIRVYEYMKY